MAVTPQSLVAKANTEDAHQTAFFCWCALQLPHCPEIAYMFHIPNGGGRGNDPRTAMIRGAKLKAQGVKPGVPDVMWPVPACVGLQWYAGLFIEMKKPKGGNKKDPDQLRWAEFLKSRGYFYRLCLTWVEAADAVKCYYASQNLPWRDTL